MRLLTIAARALLLEGSAGRLPQEALLNRAVVFHLYRVERETNEETRRQIAAAEARHPVRCKVGLDSDVPFDAAS